MMLLKTLKVLLKAAEMRFFLVFITLFGLTGCTAGVKDSANMLINLSNSYSGIWHFITGGAVLMGMAFAVRGIYYLKIYGDARTMMSSNSNLKIPVTYLLIAAVLLFLPSTFDVVMTTAFGSPDVTPLSYNSKSVGNLSVQATNAILGFIQIMGLISFVRGWVIIAKAAQGSSQGVTTGKGITHIIGGILAINIIGTKNALWATLGLS
jgi:intracellular multiplication protein IcmC